MPTRRLVELDGEYGYPKEVDPVKVKWTAVAFKAWLLSVDPENDPFEFLRQDLELVDSVLKNSLVLPYKNYRPHSRELGEGLLSNDYREISAPFYNAIRGAALYMSRGPDLPPEVIQKDGKYYAWCEFEDPPTESEDDTPTMSQPSESH